MIYQNGMDNNKGILIGLFAISLGFFSAAIEYYFKVGSIARVGVLIAFILGNIGFIVHIQEMKKPKKCRVQEDEDVECDTSQNSSKENFRPDTSFNIIDFNTTKPPKKSFFF